VGAATGDGTAPCLGLSRFIGVGVSVVLISLFSCLYFCVLVLFLLVSFCTLGPALHLSTEENMARMTVFFSFSQGVCLSCPLLQRKVRRVSKMRFRRFPAHSVFVLFERAS